MNKTILTTLLCLAVILTVHSQHYLAKELQVGNKWFYDISGARHGGHRTRGFCTQEVIGDTLINNKVYYKIKEYEYKGGGMDNTPLLDFLYREYTAFRHEYADTNIVESIFTNSSNDTLNDTIVDLTYTYGKPLYIDDLFFIPTEGSFYIIPKGDYPFAETLNTNPGRKLTFKTNFENYIQYHSNSGPARIANVLWIEKFGMACLYITTSESGLRYTLTGAKINNTIYGDTTDYFKYFETTILEPDTTKNEDSDSSDVSIPSIYQLFYNYPNPFNGITTLSYTLQNTGYVNITIYNMLGQKVATLVDGYQTGLQYTVKWNGTNDFGESVSSGIYFARMRSGDYTKTIKMAFVE